MFLIQKNPTLQFRGEVTTFKGHEIVNLREWYMGKDGEYLPGNRGVTLSTKFMEELAEGIQGLKNEVQ